MSKTTHRTPTGFKEIPCSKCGIHSIKVDSESTSATCFRCVSKEANPESVIITDLSQEEYKEFIKKLSTNGRSKITAAEGTI